MVEDPVCGLRVDEQNARFNSEHMGKKYYFCKELCKNRFDRSPDFYAERSGQPVRRRGCCS